MRRQHYTSAYLWTMAGNARTRHFYTKEGWLLDGGEYFHEGWQQKMFRYHRPLI